MAKQAAVKPAYEKKEREKVEKDRPVSVLICLQRAL